MGRLEGMQIFVAVAEAQAFSAAAKRLGLSPPVVTRAVAALEEQLGVRLLQRTTRIVRLTDAGARYLVDCRRLLTEIADAEESLSGERKELRGQLAITASVMFGRSFVAPLLLDFLALHPKVSARALLADRVLDLIEEGLDVGVRIARLTDASLTAIRVGAVRSVVVASPAYLKKQGTPRAPADLADHPAIVFSEDRSAPAWVFEHGKQRLSARARTRLVVNNSEVGIAAAIAGAGITRALSYMVAAPIKSGELRVILRDFEPDPIPIHVIHREGRNAVARVRAFVDFAVEHLRQNPLLKT